MAKKKVDVKVESYGLYKPLDKGSKELPKLVRFTEEIPCELGVEFGTILHIRNARGLKLTFQIDHPPFSDEPFTGTEHIPLNDWKFFLGDTTWEPVEDKAGEWRIRTWIDGDLVADRTLTLTR